MEYSFIIKRAQPDDAKYIQMLIKDAFSNYLRSVQFNGDLESLEETIEDIKRDIQTKEVFIGFIDDTPVGTIRVQINPNNTAYISRFGVSSNYHNMGIGKALINLVDRLLVSKNIASVSLHSASKHRDLIKFYYGRGFFIDSTTNDRGYIRALLVKNY